MRELREETGVDLAEHEPTIVDRVYVDDWRTTDHGWVCSTVALYQLPEQLDAVAADDAADAGWWPASTVDELEAALMLAGHQLYAAHRPLLTRALQRAN